ncbi:MAG: hypothetical protein ACRCX8_07735 [Sarcina sp.]
MINIEQRNRTHNALFRSSIEKRREEHNNLEYEVFRADGVSHIQVRSKAQAISIAKRIGGTYSKII